MKYLLVKSKLQFLLTALFLVATIALQAIPPQPNPPRLVNDLANILTANQRQQLEEALVAFDDSTGTQIAVVTVSDLEGYDPSQFAFEIGNTWKVGQKGLDNGVVVLIKPKMGAQDRGHAFIATGYGLEGAIPDAVANRIVELEMIPEFKKDKYAVGIYKGVSTLMKLASGEFPASQYIKKNKPKKAPVILPFLFIIIAVILMLVGRFNRARHYALGHDVSFWTALMMMSAMDNHHRGRWNHFNSGSGTFGGGFGGGSGGGFGGFGGGGFGGGGAGGSW